MLACRAESAGLSPTQEDRSRRFAWRCGSIGRSSPPSGSIGDPCVTAGTQRYLRRHRGRINSGLEPAGYVLRGGCTGYTCPIIQAAVCVDARRERVGTALVNAIKHEAGRAGSQTLGLACGGDLVEANSFWVAAGFRKIGTTAGGLSRARSLVIYRGRAESLSQPELLGLPDRKPGRGRSYASRVGSRMAACAGRRELTGSLF